MSFGERLRQLREEKELSQVKLAKKFQITSATLSQYELNKRFPDQSMLNKLADFFDVPVDYLLCRTYNRQNSNIEEKFYKENLDLIKGSMTYEEMSRDIAKKLNQPKYKKLYPANYLDSLSKGKEYPSYQFIYLFSIYAQVPIMFFYRYNTSDDMSMARLEYKRKKEFYDKLKLFSTDKHLNINIKAFIEDPSNLKYLEFAYTLKEKGINPDEIEGFSLKLR